MGKCYVMCDMKHVWCLTLCFHSHLEDTDIPISLPITSTHWAALTRAEKWAAKGVEGSW